MTIRLGIAAVLLALGQTTAVPAIAAPPPPGAPVQRCDAAALKPPADTTITSVKLIAEQARRCRIEGYVTTHNPGPNTVGFIVDLPDNWNGRYLFLIPGGSGGSVREPPIEFAQLGYAVAATDRGTHVKHPLDFSFMKDPIRLTDFFYRGPRVTTLATQALTRSYYGRERIYRYITGCSTGGVGTLVEAEWFPQDADAFIAGAVDADGGPQDFWSYVAQSIYRNPKKWISEDEMRRISATIMETFDGTDGAMDRLIWDPTRIVLDRKLFPYLSDDQFWMLQVLGGGFANAGGVAQGYWLSNPVPLATAVLGSTPPPWTDETLPRLFIASKTGAEARYGPSYNILTDADFTKKQPDPALPPGPGRLSPSNLSRIQQTGGKVITYIGSADQNSSPQNHIDYLRQVQDLYGAGRVQWFRAFFVPGMYHCSGGEGQPTDAPLALLRAAQAWVEEGRAPDHVIAANPEIRRTYRLCSYPQVAQFKGGPDNPRKLDVNDAANWECTGRMNR